MNSASSTSANGENRLWSEQDQEQIVGSHHHDHEPSQRRQGGQNNDPESYQQHQSSDDQNEQDEHQQYQQHQQQDHQYVHQQQQQLQQEEATSVTAASLSFSSITRTSISTTSRRKLILPSTTRMKSAAWLATAMLKQTDLSSGVISMFHNPTDSIPMMKVNDMKKAFDMIFEEGANTSGDNGNQGDLLLSPNAHGAASLEVRNQVVRIQFSWYQFQEFPRHVMGRTYVNLQHLDVRQNASLTCIESLVSQLPHLSSLNLSDCPNIRTLAPLATALIAITTLPLSQRDDDGVLQHEDASDDDSSSSEAPFVVDNNLNPHPSNQQHQRRRTLNLRHLSVRGCNLSNMSRGEWSDVFDALAESSGPMERLTLSRNNMSYLHDNIGKLKGLTYLFVEDNDDGSTNSTNNNNYNDRLKKHDDTIKAFKLPDGLGDLSNLRFVSFCGNNITRLPKTMGRLPNDCGIRLHRGNPHLTYPPDPSCRESVRAMRHFFHEERMALLRGIVLFAPYCERARMRANERLYRPGGRGYLVCKERFERGLL